MLRCRLQKYCDTSSGDAEDFELQGRSFFCSNLDSQTGLPTGNEFNWAVLHMLMIKNDLSELVRHWMLWFDVSATVTVSVLSICLVRTTSLWSRGPPVKETDCLMNYIWHP